MCTLHAYVEANTVEHQVCVTHSALHFADMNLNTPVHTVQMKKVPEVLRGFSLLAIPFSTMILAAAFHMLIRHRKKTSLPCVINKTNGTEALLSVDSVSLTGHPQLPCSNGPNYTKKMTLLNCVNLTVVGNKPHYKPQTVVQN